VTPFCRAAPAHPTGERDKAVGKHYALRGYWPATACCGIIREGAGHIRGKAVCRPSAAVPVMAGDLNLGFGGSNSSANRDSGLILLVVEMNCGLPR